MKKKTLLILAVLITALACLFTSCSASVEPPKAEEEFGYVTFGNGGSRSLTTLYGIKNYDDLYWYYTAEKKDGFGLTGQTDGQTAVPPKTGDGKGIGSGTIRLSQGAWEFELFAYESARTGTTSDNLVYQGKSDIIVLKGGETKAVPISVSLQGATGLINLSRAWFEWANNSDADGKISVTVELAKDGSDPITYFFGPLTRSGAKYTFALTTDTKIVDEGYYTCTVNAYMKEDVNVTAKTVNVDATPLATQTLGLRVYGNATTYITGNLTEGIFAKVVFDVAEQDMKVFVPNTDGSASITGISVTPSGDTTKTTSVEFSENALSGLADDATLQLDVKVTPVEAAFEKFQVSGTTANNKSAFAGIDITLMQTTANGEPVAVDSFNSDPDTTATVTTYIATGLSGVSVHYSSDNGTTKDFIIGTEAEFVSGSAQGYYESETGKLVFTTTHFSEYYVLANCVAFNCSRNVAYATLEKAIDYAQTGDIVKLMADYTIPASNKIEIAEGKNFTLDLNGKTITEEGAGARKIINRGELTIIDSFGTGKIQNKYVGESGKDGSYGLIDNYGTLTIESGNFTDVAHGNGSSFRNRPGATLIINGGTFVNTADDSGKQASGFTGAANAFVYSDGADVRINGGTFTMQAAMYTPAIKIMDGTGSIEGATISTYKSGGVEVGCEVEIRNTNISVSETNSYYANAIAVSNDGRVDVYSGTFTGYQYGAYIYSSGGIINIYGGTINAETALRADNDVYVPKNSEINVYGGSFRGEYTVGTEAKLAITGGTFSVDPSAYVANGYAAVKTGNSSWIVGESSVIREYTFSDSADELAFCADCYNHPETEHSGHKKYLNINNGVAEVKIEGAWMAFTGLDWANEIYSLEYDVDLSSLAEDSFVAFDSGETVGWQDIHLGFKRENGGVVAYNTLFVDQLNDSKKLGTIGNNVHVSYTYDCSGNTLNMSMFITDGTNGYSVEKTVDTFNTSANLCWDVYKAYGESEIYAKLDNFRFKSISK